ncbi:MAG: lantibiotic immunity ABC transporter MutG family permease subunit [Lachnospiraceae bacterium]
MGNFRRNIQAEVYKMIHSALLPFHLFIPLLCAVVFLAYYRISIVNEVQKVTGYLQVLAIAFPFVIGIIGVMSSEQEHQAGSFQMVLFTAGRKQVPHWSKLLVLLLLGLGSSLMAALGFGIAFWGMGNTLLPISFYLKAGILLFIANLPLYIATYMICYAFGKGTGILFGIVGSLISALLLTGLGDRIWPFLPWSIGEHFCSILVESERRKTNFLEMAGVKSGLLFLLIFSFVLLLILHLWALKWEGRNEEMD